MLTLVACSLWLASAIRMYENGHGRSFLPIIVPLFLCIITAWTIIPSRTLLGPIRHVQIQSLQIIEKIRTRYRSETDQFASLGFVPLFYYGEGFSVLRLFLIFPAVVVIFMLLKREVLSLQEGHVVECYSAFAARDNSALAHAFGLGVKFYTGFTDGTLLITKNFVNDMGNRPGIVEYARKASISEIWTEHQRQVQTFEAEGKRIDRQTSFEFYSELSRKDS
jgi:hypothetical protein